MTMRKIKDAVKDVLPMRWTAAARRCFHMAKAGWTRQKIARAGRVLAAASTEPAWLEPDMLTALHGQYSFPPPTPKTQEERIRQGRLRIRQLQSLLGTDGAALTDFLEIGCGSGLTSLSLAGEGRKVMAVDIDGRSFDPAARAAGVTMLEMDVQKLEFDDNSFDCVFSYGAYEHIPDPARAFAESLRVLRPGGLMFMQFGPLYNSSEGAHVYRLITVPYCQHLFEPQVIHDFAHNLWQGHPELRVLDGAFVNRWTLAQYRRVWNDHREHCHTRFYLEIADVRHLNLIERFPSCFRSKSGDIHEFTVGHVNALFQKHGG